MIVDTDFRSNYPDDPVRHFHFESDGQGPVFKYGIHKPVTPIDIYLCLEEPIVTPGEDLLTWGPLCKKILTLCPFTTEWIKKEMGIPAQCVFFPTNPKYLPVNFEKKYDLIYCGNLSDETIRLLEIASKICKICVVSMSPHHLVTHSNVSYIEKLNLIAQSKICMVHNIAWCSDYAVHNIVGFAGYNNNPAYRLVKSHKILPQIKSRTFEAAFGKSLILSRNDPWNLIDMYFSNQYIGYDVSSFAEILQHALSQDNNHMIENAYQMAINNYTTDHFKERFLQ